MPEWLVERGIGESRAVRAIDGEIVDARILLDGMARAGTRLAARLTAVGPPTIAEADGQQYLLPRGARGISEGAALVVEVTREAIPGAEPWKRPLAAVTQESPGSPEPLDAEALPFPADADRLAQLGWNDLVEEARSGVVRFAGGELRISATPAMTLIDVDGYLPARELAVAGASAAARAMLRLDIGGSIGIDLPTAGNRAARQEAAAAIDERLPPPFERTAVNGFGFVQIVRPRRRASLVELGQDRAAFEARALLRRTAFEPAGAKRLVAHPAVVALLQGRKDWLDDLARQVGGAVELRADAALPMSGGYAETR
ncbi:MAG TPA: ribonuclease [Sphingomicrobium sp.]|nr:ribonuclease [Sphingomicrobium sp.]